MWVFCKYLVQQESTLCKCTASEFNVTQKVHSLKIMDIYLENKNIKLT